MGHAYRAVGWNRQKKRYDLALTAGIIGFLGLFIGSSIAFDSTASIETLVLRAFGTGAFVLLHVILIIGPLTRIDRRFLPLLYNRRHLGVAMFGLALLHGGFATLYFHGFGDTFPLVSVLSSNQRIDSLAQFPFEILGVAALMIFSLMAATSHDFWLTNLSAPVWKALHMLVYLAYLLVVGHVALGTLQGETSVLLQTILTAGIALVVVLQLWGGLVEWRKDHRPSAAAVADGFVHVGRADDLVEGRGVTVSLGGDRVALFQHEGRVHALSNACQHQNGPLGEGRILNGCVVCPWHGYEYQPACGRSPEPFTEKVPTFRTRIVDGNVLVHPTPLPAGTEIEGARIEGDIA
jgi:methionine sulfoxide reductase heme-binding subunit